MSGKKKDKKKGVGAYTDLFHIYPADGKVNSKRGDLPLGYVDKAQKASIFTSNNGSMIGPCKNKKAPKGTCFEVADALKGDLARSYFYMSMFYRGSWKHAIDTAGVNGAYLKPWMEEDLRFWHKGDPVDKFEQARNESIFKTWQGNRNPFIDRPEYVDAIETFGEPAKPAAAKAKP